MGKDREEAWRKVRDAFELMGSFVREQDDETPFFASQNPCFFDFHVAAALIIMRVILGEEMETELAGCSNGRWMKLLEALSDIAKIE